MKKKYLIAIIPPEKILQQIETIKQELFTEHGLKGALRSPAHITLHRPFEWRENKEPLLIEKLGQFKFKEKFPIDLKNFGCFEPRVIFIDVLKNDILQDLHRQLTTYAGTRLKLLNEAEDMRGFHPHVTIAFRDLKKQKFYDLWISFKTRNFDEKFYFTGVSLLKMDKKWEILRHFNI